VKRNHLATLICLALISTAMTFTPAVAAGRDVSTEEISARETKVAIRLRFTGDLQVVDM